MAKCNIKNYNDVLLGYYLRTNKVSPPSPPPPQQKRFQITTIHYFSIHVVLIESTPWTFNGGNKHPKA